MGISFSCPFAKYNDVEDGLDSVVVKSINFGNDEIKTPVRSVSFKKEDLEPTILKSLGSGKMTIETSVSFKRKDIDEIISTNTLSFEKEENMPIARTGKKIKEMDDMPLKSENQVETIQSALLNPSSPKHIAALKLQKVYKSFRTRRKLADCAILVEQSWWKLLDFAELKRSSISFFDIEKHETAVSRWSRARTRAAKVGKGLSKDDKAQKLALQHWLEAIDPRHRYGHNLHFYYDKWLRCQSREPFFYWLDIGEGKEVNLDKCPRFKLQQQCIKYLGPMERLAYEVVVEDGKFFYKQSGELLNTTGKDAHAKWIFVLSTSKTLYVGKKSKGSFQHSSFLAGGATSSAGRLVVEHGVLKAVWPHSGHYRPTEENFKEFISFLQENNVSLSDVKMDSVDEADELRSLRSGHLRSHSSEEDFTENMNGLEIEDTILEASAAEEKANLIQTERASAVMTPRPRQFQILGRELSNLEIPKRGGHVFEGLEKEVEGVEESCESLEMESDSVDEETTEEKKCCDDNDVESIPPESILKRINSHKEMKSYQLGKQLSCKWTTGAGPRIGCVRDYPCELQFRALEQVNLSPRSGSRYKSSFTPRNTTLLNSSLSNVASLCGDTSIEALHMAQRGEQNSSRSECSPLFRGTSVIPVIHTS
ncbi:IQ domain-containing protein IQM2 [Vigna radiata var. radiata]|uniref:IQ domain-containing protein IQM2 n=1 Tax=Vigna radiata var. radiata TaxID=3916 RepID=A0A1S3VZ12_VIGRR|nr:IQ domain-containing protein IQM2 [Vigna radiata var. radiata]